MALKRGAYTRPQPRKRLGVGERGAGGEGEAVRPALEPALVQILVIVANIQMRTLKAEVEKGSA